MGVTPNCDSINSLNICNASGIQAHPDIAFDGGNYMVVWSDGRASYCCIYAARVTPSGTVLDPNGFLLGPSTATHQYDPAIAFTGTQYFVIWDYLTPYAITGRFINTDGSLGDTVRVATTSDCIYCPRVAYDGTNFLVVWVTRISPSLTLRGQLVSGDGSLIGSPFTIASPLDYYYATSLRFDGINYIVTYTLMSNGDYQIWGRKYSPSGVPVDSAFRISNSSYNCYYCDVFPGADNHYLNVWSEDRDSQYDIYGNVDIEITGIEEHEELITTEHFRGLSISPNPFRERTDISFSVGHPDRITHSSNGTGSAESIELKIFDITGRLVRSFPVNNLCNSDKSMVSVHWDGKDEKGCKMSDGIYFVRLESGGSSQTQKVILLH